MLLKICIIHIKILYQYYKSDCKIKFNFKNQLEFEKS